MKSIMVATGKMAGMKGTLMSETDTWIEKKASVQLVDEQRVVVNTARICAQYVTLSLDDSPSGRLRAVIGGRVTASKKMVNRLSSRSEPAKGGSAIC